MSESRHPPDHPRADPDAAIKAHEDAIRAHRATRAIVTGVHAGGVDVSLLGNVTTLSWEQLESLRADIESVQRKYGKP